MGAFWETVEFHIVQKRYCDACSWRTLYRYITRIHIQQTWDTSSLLLGEFHSNDVRDRRPSHGPWRSVGWLSVPFATDCSSDCEHPLLCSSRGVEAAGTALAVPEGRLSGWSCRIVMQRHRLQFNLLASMCQIRGKRPMRSARVRRHGVAHKERHIRSARRHERGRWKRRFNADDTRSASHRRCRCAEDGVEVMVPFMWPLAGGALNSRAIRSSRHLMSSAARHAQSV